MGNNRQERESDRAEMRRDQVLEAAAQCFRQHGFHGSSIARISAAAGMSSGHIYHYFANKEAIVAAIVKREESELDELFERMEHAGKSTDLVTALIEQTEASVSKHTDTNHSVLILEILAEAARNPQIAKLIQQSDKVVRSKCRALFSKVRGRSRRVTEADIEGRMELIAALFEGLAIRALRNPSLDKAATSRVARTVIRHILEA